MLSLFLTKVYERFVIMNTPLCFLGGSDISAEAIKLSAKAAGSISDSGLFLLVMYLKTNDWTGIHNNRGFK